MPLCLIWTLWGLSHKVLLIPCRPLRHFKLLTPSWYTLRAMFGICHIASQAKQKDALGYFLHSENLTYPVTFWAHLTLEPALRRVTCVALPVNAPTNISKYPTAGLVVAQAQFQWSPISQYAHQKFMGRGVGVELQNHSSGVASRIAWDFPHDWNQSSQTQKCHVHVPCLAKCCPQYIFLLGMILWMCMNILGRKTPTRSVRYV